MTVNDWVKYFALIEQGKDDEAHALRENSIPDRLIKFVWLDENTSDDKKFLTLENNQLWFSTVSMLNDPYEYKGMYIDEDTFRNAGYPDNIIDKYRKFLEFEEWGLVSLSGQTIDYLPLWAYYTNNYKGYCIEYDVVKKSAIHQVIYEPKRIPIAHILVELKSKLSDAISQGQEPPAECRRLANIVRQNLYIKSLTWAHEKEYRIAYPISNDRGENIDISKLGLKVKRIIAGINCSQKNINRLNSISNSIGIGNIYKSKLSDIKYGMEFDRYIVNTECVKKSL